jgi:hypothetical protein
MGALVLPAGLTTYLCFLPARDRPPVLQPGLACLGIVLVGGIVFLGVAVLGSRYSREPVTRLAAVLVGLIYFPMLFLVGLRPNPGHASLDSGGFQISSLLLYSLLAETIPMSFLLVMVWLWQRLSRRKA